MHGGHIDSALKAVAESLFPSPADVALVQPYGFRRFGATLAQITQTPAQDLIEYGGWAGAPELSQITTESSAALAAWKKSMPFTYSDRHREGEELQKLLHIEMLRGLLAAGETIFETDWVASWDAVERAAARPSPGGTHATVMEQCRLEAMARVTDLRHAATSSKAFGSKVAIRRQFVIKKVSTSVFAVKQRTKRGREEALIDRSDQLGPEDMSVPPPPAKDPAALIWYSTFRMTLTHRKSPGEGWIPACLHGQARAKAKPVPADQIMWSGTLEEVRLSGRCMCPSPECSWA